MSGTKSSFEDLDETHKSSVRLEENKQVKVEGKGIVAIKTIQGNVNTTRRRAYSRGQ